MSMHIVRLQARLWITNLYSRLSWLAGFIITPVSESITLGIKSPKVLDHKFSYSTSIARTLSLN